MRPTPLPSLISVPSPSKTSCTLPLAAPTHRRMSPLFHALISRFKSPCCGRYTITNFSFSPVVFKTVRPIPYVRAKYIAERVYKGEITEDTGSAGTKLGFKVRARRASRSVIL